ncbi:tail tape measure protein [uncultured Mediterranean phage uvDeep-CGR2-KM22-C255]|nr:tail tape measure protein [uncultured Mediterranean phage uvDeep-CGR2-KM22-C255]
MDALFNVFGFGMQKPDEKYKFFENQRDRNIEEEKRRRGIFWKDKTNTGIDFTSMGGTGPLDQKGRQILPSDKNYPGTNINQIQNQNRYQDPIQTGGVGQSANNEDMGFMSKLANMAGVDIKEATANWKDKGGFEGLMSNPGFTLGLALMQSSAQGKRIDEGILDNFVKAAGISAQFKDRMDARKMEPIQATSGDIAEVKDMLKSINIEKGNWLENFLGGTESGAKYEAAVEEVAVQFQEKIREAQAKLKREGKSQVIRRTDQIQILRKLINEGKIKKKGGFLGIFSATIQKDLPTGKARGGPVKANKTYVVGEEGPEYFLPKESGKILSNDDSRIFAMLLAANPQLQQVSKTRAEKIMRSRFPEYFD